MIRLPNLTSRQWATAVVIAFADFCSAVCVSLQAPFYPAEAERKGATASQYGLVFGIFELTVFIVSPIFGKYLTRLNPKFMFNAGLFVTGICSVLFGVLDRVSSAEDFISLSFVVRTVEAVGNAAFLTASFALVAAEFPNSVATTFASLETFFGLGLIVGPTLGGALYQYGGYMVPFTVLGALLVASSILTYAILPGCEYADISSEGGLLRALRIPSILVAVFSVLAAAVSIGFLSATLEPHLRQFSLSPVVMGLMFVIEGGVYAITAPIWGYLCDRKLQPKIVTFIGSVLVTIGFLFIGPVPFLPLETTLGLAVTGLAVMGFGIGAELVSGFISALHEATIHGFPNNLATYGMVSGLWTSTFALGSFIGPSVAGILYDHVGFRYSTLFVVAFNFLLVICVSLFTCFGRRSFDQDHLGKTASYHPLTTGENVEGTGTVGNRNYGTQQQEDRPDLLPSLKQGFITPEWSTATDQAI